MNKVQEKYLLLQIQSKKDEKAFTRVYELLSDQIYRFIYFKVGDPDLAQELTSDVFLRSWRALTGEQSDSIKHLKAYFYQIARNIIVDHYRKPGSSTVLLDEHIDVPAKEDAALTIQVQLDATHILQVMKSLKENYQEVIILHFVEELSIKEISSVIGKSSGATRVLLHRASQALKREYEKIAKTT